MNRNFLSRYVGDKAFYRGLIALILPMIVQQGITNFVNLLDNLMVGSLGTADMSGVAIVNQLVFVFNITLFGMTSGVSIFGAQFFGKGDYAGMRNATRLKLLAGAAVTAAAMGLMTAFGPQLVGLFLNAETNDPAAMAQTMASAMDYLRVIIWGFAPFMVVNCYSTTLREAGHTVSAMVAGVAAVLVNLTGNYLLIFGHFGFPQMGAAGAALATVISRWVEMAILVVDTHRQIGRFAFFKGLYTGFRVPLDLCKKVLVTGSPLIANEILWSVGTTFVNQNYSLRGLTAVAAVNITTTCWQLFCVIMFTMGGAISVLVGQQLGAGEIEKAKDTDRKLLFFNLVLHVVIGGLLMQAAPFVPRLYNTEPEVRTLASWLLVVAGASLPIHAYAHGAYFTIRSGGKTFITFLFDSCYTWVVSVTISFCLARFTALPLVAIYAAVQFADVLKICIAVPMLNSGFWAQNVVSELGEADS